MTDDLPDDARPTEADGPVTIRVGDETFTVEVSDTRSFNYRWDSGPNPGYGFSEQVRTACGIGRDPAKPRYDPNVYPTIAEHRLSAENFLAMVDPETGYIE